MNNDQFPLIRFAGFANTATLTAPYQFTPFQGKPYSLQTSTGPRQQRPMDKPFRHQDKCTLNTNGLEAFPLLRVYISGQ